MYIFVLLIFLNSNKILFKLNVNVFVHLGILQWFILNIRKYLGPKGSTIFASRRKLSIMSTDQYILR